jgi:hypothetical protein
MADTQKVRSAWLHKMDFCVEDWARLLDIFDVDEDIRDRTFAIDVLDAQAIAKPAREEDY